MTKKSDYIVYGKFLQGYSIFAWWGCVVGVFKKIDYILFETAVAPLICYTLRDKKITLRYARLF